MAQCIIRFAIRFITEFITRFITHFMTHQVSAEAVSGVRQAGTRLGIFQLPGWQRNLQPGGSG